MLIPAAVLAVLIIIAAAGGGSKKNDASSSSTSSEPTSTAPRTTESIGAPDPTGAPITEPPTTAPRQTAPPATAAPDEVTYDCAGTGSGVDITYGDDSSNTQGALPLHVVAPLSEDAQYYSISAQLNGSGTVTCRVTVHFGGQVATKVGTATGGYNIASVEVCSTFDGGFEAC